MLVRSSTYPSYQTVPRPISMIVVEHEPTSSVFVPWHSHPRAQLTFATKGTFTLLTEERAWVVPSHHAVWIPGNVAHEVRSCGQAVSGRSMYIDPEVDIGLPTGCEALAVSPMLRHLIIEAERIPVLYQEASRDGRVMRLIIDEICRAPKVPVQLPMPSDPRLQRICHALLTMPGASGDLDYWASYGAIGRRTLMRHFRQEAGMTFTTWRQHARLIEALSRLSKGVSVSLIAAELGYESHSAFSAMFKRVMGQSPTQFLSATQKGGQPQDYT